MPEGTSASASRLEFCVELKEETVDPLVAQAEAAAIQIEARVVHPVIFIGEAERHGLIEFVAHAGKGLPGEVKLRVGIIRGVVPEDAQIATRAAATVRHEGRIGLIIAEKDRK